MGWYYDRQGKPISMEQWGELRTPEHKRVAETTIGQLWISTVWLGLDMGFSRNNTHRPLIFETMVFLKTTAARREANLLPAPAEVLMAERKSIHPELVEWVDSTWRWSTEEEAIEGHDKICVDLRQLIANIEMADQVLGEAIARVKEGGPGNA